MEADVEMYDVEGLNQVLRSFYPPVQNSTGKPYFVTSYVSLRSGISRHFSKFDVIKSPSFTSSNGVLKSVIKTLHKNGQDVSEQLSAVVTEAWSPVRFDRTTMSPAV